MGWDGHCVKSVQIKSFFLVRIFPYLDWIWRDTDGVSLRIQSECGKIRTRKNSVFGHFSRSRWFTSSLFATRSGMLFHVKSRLDLDVSWPRIYSTGTIFFEMVPVYLSTKKYEYTDILMIKLNIQEFGCRNMLHLMFQSFFLLSVLEKFSRSYILLWNSTA